MKKKILSIAVISIFLFPLVALAHQPRLVLGDTTQVKNPEISQAFYGQLKNHGQYFEINSDKFFNLYIGLLIPSISGAKITVSAEVIRVNGAKREIIGVLDGPNFAWTPFYEPFGGDHYLKGPEFKIEAEPGQYLIHVFSRDYNEKYSLAIGEQESFSLEEIIKTLILLPQLKSGFFNKLPLTAYLNYTGLFLLGFLIIIAAIVFVVVKIVKKKRNL